MHADRNLKSVGGEFNEEVLNAVRRKLNNSSISMNDLSGAVYKFRYYKKNNGSLMEMIDLVDVFDAGDTISDTSRAGTAGEQHHYTGSYTITIDDNGYNLSCQGTNSKYNKTINPKDYGVELKPNKFGFAAQRYMTVSTNDRGINGHLIFENIQVSK